MVTALSSGGKFEYRPLGDLAVFINGCAFKPTDWEDEGLPIIRIQNLTGTQDKYNRTTRSVAAKYHIIDGDLLISWSASLGVYIWLGGKAVLNQHIFKAEPHEGVDKDYLYYVVQHVLDLLKAKTHGSTMKHVKRGDFEETLVPFPSIDEQRRIVDILKRADSIRRLRKQAQDTARQLIPALFTEMFGDPATNPEGWPISAFGDVCDCRLGKMLDKKQQTGKHLRPYLRNANVQWDRFELSDMLEMDFFEKDRKTFSLRKGDVLICEGGEVGRAAIWNDDLAECYFQKALHRARPYSEVVTSEYLLWLMRALAKSGGLVDATSQATIAHLTGVKLKSLRVPIPPIERQKRFVAQVDSIHSILSQQESAKQSTESSFQSLLHLAFNGGI
jgi:type I restriction enzyme S subunit